MLAIFASIKLSRRATKLSEKSTFSESLKSGGEVRAPCTPKVLTSMLMNSVISKFYCFYFIVFDDFGHFENQQLMEKSGKVESPLTFPE